MIEEKYNEPPFWLKIIGKISRTLPNYPKLKLGLMLVFKKKIKDKNYRTIVRYDLGQRIILNLDDWIPSQFFCGLYLVEKKKQHFSRRLFTIASTQKVALRKKNVKSGGNDVQLNKIIDYYNLNLNRLLKDT